MKTDIIEIYSTGSHMETALSQADKVSAYKGLDSKSAMHLRLLTEEMLGMMRSITGETRGKFWIEDDGQMYQLHLLVETRMNSSKRSQLLSVATNGANESARGLMGWLRDLFDRSVDEDVASYTNPLLMSGMLENTSTPVLDWEWSMERYEERLTSMAKADNAQAKEAWDELEKSVVHSVADEVKVSIKGQQAELTIYKKLPSDK